VVDALMRVDEPKPAAIWLVMEEGDIPRAVLIED